MKIFADDQVRVEMERVWRSFAAPGTDWDALDDLVSLAERYVKLRMFTGYRFHTEGRAILDFARFLKDQGVTSPGEIPIEHFLAYFDRFANVRPYTWNRHLGTISLWLDHLRSIGKIRRNPCVFLGRRKGEYMPYIFSMEELRRIVRPESADPERALRAVGYHFIYALGLRISEAAKLVIRDVHWDERTVFIRRSKFSKDRLLPVHPKILARVEEALAGRGGRAVLQPGEPLFVTRTRERWTPHYLSDWFRRDVHALGIYRPGRVTRGLIYGSPRAHGLRHSMACHRLIRWYREGADVQAKLPLLATYLGHASYEYSQVYLKITALVLREADKRFAGAFEKEFALEP